jgi:hypothetical protein
MKYGLGDMWEELVVVYLMALEWHFPVERLQGNIAQCCQYYG